MPGPSAFEFVNTTDSTLYVNLQGFVGCRQLSDIACTFSSGWCPPVPCSQVSADGLCCVECEPPPVAALAVPPGERRSLPWDGRIFNLQQGNCVDCNCSVETTSAATYIASVAVYFSYACVLATCVEQADGRIEGASVTGAATKYEASFSLPSSDEFVTFVF